MALYEYESAVSSVKNNGTNHYVYLSLNKPLTDLASIVPPYSVLNATLVIYADTSTASNDATLNLSLTNSDGSTTYLSEFSKNNVVDGNGSSITNYSTFEIDVKNWFNQGNASAGELIGYGGVNTYIKCHFKLYTLTNYTWAAKYKLIVNYYPPQVNVSVSSNIGNSTDIVTTSKSIVSCGDSFTITAKAVDGYKFVKWDDGNTSATRMITVRTSSSGGDEIVVSATNTDKTYTAIYEVAKTNKIYIGTSQPKKIYIGTQEVKAVYVGTTKVYG